MRKKIYSLKKYMILSCVVFISLLLIIFIINGTYFIMKYRANLVTNTQIVVDNYAYSMNKDIESMENYIKRIYSDNVHYKTLTRDNLSEIDWFRESYYLSNTLQVKVGSFDYFGGMFFYDAQENALRSSFSEYEYEGDLYHLNQTLKQTLQAVQHEMVYEGIFFYEGEAYLFYQTGTRTKKVGFAMNLNRYFAQEEGFQIIISDKEQEIMVNTGTLQINEEQKKEILYGKGDKRIGTEYIVIDTAIEIVDLQLTVIHHQPGILHTWMSRDIVLLFVLIPIVTICVFMKLYQMINQILLQSVDHLLYRITQMKDEKNHSIIEKKEETRIEEFITINARVDEMIEEMETLQKEKYKKEMEANAAQLQYYQLQVNPHFFINCLNIIQSLLNKDNVNTVNEMIYSLSNHFRYVFQNRSNMVTIEEELKEINAYLNIYMIKGNMPILCQNEVDEDIKSCKIPILCMQPFVENSIKHASQMGKILTIKIVANKVVEDKQEYMNIRISDNGSGYPPEKLKELNKKITEFQYFSRHVGIDNVKYRIYLMYGDEAKINFYNGPSGEAVTELLLPVKQTEV